MKEIYREAFVEISEILKIMPKTIVDKIPNKFKEIIENEKSMTYISNIKEPLEQCALKEETIIILSLIYRDFLCNKEEKTKLQYRDAQKIKEAEDELKEKYNPEDIFKKEEKNEDNHQETGMIKYKEQSFIKRLFEKIKNIFIRG